MSKETLYLVNLKRGCFLASLFFLVLLFTACGKGGAESLFKKGEKLRASGKYAEAIERYNDLVLHHEKSEYAPEALYHIGEVSYLFLSDFGTSVQTFKKLIDRYPSSRRAAKAQTYLADIHMHKLQEYKQAIIEYQKAIAYSTDDVEKERFQYEIASAYFNLKNFEQQRIEFNLFLKQYPESKLRDSIYFQIANSFYIEGKMDEAILAYQQLIEEFPDTSLAVEAIFQVASCLEEKEELEEAVKLLQEIEGVYPNPEIVRQRIERMNSRHKKRRR